MKKCLALLLAIAMVLTGCAQSTTEKVPTSSPEISHENVEITSTVISPTQSEIVIPDEEIGDDSDYEYKVEFNDLDDDNLLKYVEDNVYAELVNSLNSEEYYVENVTAKYISKEYLEEVAYNSKSNIFFGYTLAEIDEAFGDTKYVFTLGDNGETVVEPFEDYDDTYERVIKNVAIGTGVILVCVTVSVVTAGAGAPAVSLIFAASAKTGTIMALSSSVISGVASGVVTGLQTGDMNEALKAAALEGSEAFKWGAITGAIAGGASETAKYAKAMKALKGVELNITTQEAAAIQMQSGFPVDVIAQFHSMEEYEVFKSAGLKAAMVNGESALVRTNIDLNYVDPWGRTNLQRMKLGLSPLDSTGNYYELHHIGQEADATLAILTQAEHDNAVLHGFKTISEIDRTAFNTQRTRFWKAMAKYLESLV